MDAPPAKKQALQANRLDLDDFKVIKILLNDSKHKRIHVHGRFKDCEEDAIITLVKPPFSEDVIPKILSADTSFEEVFQNDIYSQLSIETHPKHNSIIAQVIQPATEKHIQKYTQQPMVIVEETAEDYRRLTLPYIQEQSLRVEWVYNILNHKTEVERIIFEDANKETGFILVPDLKWNGQQIENLYVCGICHCRDIKSIRDLNEMHLPLLKNLRSKGLEAIENKYGVPANQIRAYFHYYPTYYHLHVHYNHIYADVDGTGAGKAHLLTDVIDNIENIAHDYYQRKALPVLLRAKDPLLAILSKTPREERAA